MIVPMVVVEVKHEKSQKSGKEYTRWICQDRTPESFLYSCFVYMPSADELNLWGDKLTGKVLQLAVTQIEAGFGGLMNFRGRVLVPTK